MAQFREEAFSESGQPIRFAGSMLGEKRHICAFFHNPEEEYRVLLPFIKEGFERGEKAFHQENSFFVPPDEFLRELRERRATHGGSPP
jgi:hypothetical protein